MIKLSKKYILIPVILVMAILLSPLGSAIGLNQLTILWEKMINISSAEAHQMNENTLEEAAPVVFTSFDDMEEIEGAIEIEYGQMVSGTIDPATEVDAYSFNGNAGDEIRMSGNTTSGTMSPRMRLYRPDGTQLCDGTDYGDAPLVVKECTLENSGSHTIRVDDRNGDDTGTYELYIQNIYDPANITSLGFEQMISSAIDPAVDVDVYTFNGNAGDEIRMSGNTTSGTMSPRMRLYRPDRTQLCDGTDYGDASLVVKECTLEDTGTHFILVDDRVSNDTGTYDLYLQNLYDPANLTPIEFEQITSGTIDPAVDVDIYTFNGNAGDEIRMSGNTTSGTMSPRMRLYRPDRTQLCDATDYGDAPNVVKECTLEDTGTHFILVDDRVSNDTGSYELYLQCLICTPYSTPTPTATPMQATPTATPTPNAEVDILFDGFENLSPLTLNGDAVTLNSAPVVVDGKTVLRLTNGNYNSSSALLTAPVALTANGNPVSFNTHFQFQITNSGGVGGGADGLTFIVAPSPNSLGNGEGNLGYGGITPSFVVELDTYLNSGWDENGNHLGININGEMESEIEQNITPDFNNDQVWYVWIDYDAASQMLEVRVSETETRPTMADLSYEVDLVSILGQEYAFVGFTSGTGGGYGDHDICFWEFSTLSGAPITPTPTTTPTVTPTSTPPAGFAISGMTPNEGMTGQSTDVTISGNGFVGNPSVQLRNRNSTHDLENISRPNAMQLDATVPADLPAGLYDLLVINPDGQSAVLASAFSVLSTEPVIIEVLPNQGIANLPNNIIVYGSGFASGATITIGETALSTTRINGNQLQAVVPAGLDSGSYTVTVTNPGDEQAELVNGYTVYGNDSNNDLFGYPYEIWLNPTAPRAGEQVELGFFVHRQGGRNALANVRVRFFRDSENGTLLGDSTIPFIDPPNDVQSTIPLEVTFPEAGTFDIVAVIDPDNEVVEDTLGEMNNVISRTVTIGERSGDQTVPVVNDIQINDGALQTTAQSVSLELQGTDPNPNASGMQAMSIIEYEYNIGASMWVPVQQSNWLPYDMTPETYSWQLQPSAGMRYLQVRALDNAGNISIGDARKLISYDPPSDSVAFRQTRVYRYEVAEGEELDVLVEVISGDPDLYVWSSNEAESARVSNQPTGNEQVIISPDQIVPGVYQIEVYGYSDAEYRLEVTIGPATGRASTINQIGTLGIRGPKPLPSAPVLPVSSVPNAQQCSPPPPTTTSEPEPSEYWLYLPAITR